MKVKSAKMTWNLPSLDPDFQLLENLKNYLIVDETVLPFNQIHQASSQICFKDLLETLQLPQEAQLAIASHQMTYPSQWHNHDYIELLYILEGRLFHLTSETTHVLERNSLCVIPIEESHLITPIDNEPATVVNVLVHPSLFQKITELDPHFSNNVFQKPLILESTVLNEELVLNLKTFILDYYKNAYRPTLITIAHFIIVLHGILNQTQPHQNTFDQLTKDCLHLIKNGAPTITQHQLSQQMSYSQGHLSRHIRQQTGQTISYHIAQAKLDKARQLLLETQLTIHQVAEQSGYQSESHFHRLFKKQMSMTPKQYRKIVQ
ncbi:helix-turn-helix transcriptional regulator [Streptococcus moroccensis]|uniref:AraC-like DNA-binding protein/mannose-6-phosphate isomerase-like protein (Cupin superfamily) n=1 Tax=Streptococcus moroccensis TaxID=1451356 RepID=A0ABT9YTH3_9STRE|nr:AraC family transcriptional regulator [Streptococcus moroccensis]MDQ0223187.1 AraC-like DNA-binding protein/mannose-6-phosphate isomerase-like protein (cupin superfamily) [Streptococcus moroccensis]